MPTTDDWSTTPASNASTAGVSIAEGCAASNLNDWGRAIMAQLKAKLDSLDSDIVSATGQPLDATLTALAAVTFAADKLLYATGADAFALTDVTSVARTLIGKSTVGAMLTYLGFAASGNATSGHCDIPFETFGTLRINWGTATVGTNTTTTAALHANFSTGFVAVGGSQSTDTGAGDDVFVWLASNSTVGLTNGTNSMPVSWVAIGLA